MHGRPAHLSLANEGEEDRSATRGGAVHGGVLWCWLVGCNSHLRLNGWRCLIRLLTDQNPFAHSLRPMDMIRQGWVSSFRQASQQ